MKLLDRIFGRAETRAMAEPSWAFVAGMNTAGGHLVDARSAESQSACLAAVDAIASALAGLPAWVFRTTPKGRVLVPDHPLQRLIRNGMNDRMTWCDGIQWAAASVLLRGNALIEIRHDPRTGELLELVPHPWDFVTPVLLSSGRLVFDIAPVNSLYGSTGRTRRLLQDEVILLKDRTDDGLIGRSRLSRAGAVIAAGLSLQEFSSSLVQNGINPTGAFRADGVLTKAQKDQIRDGLRTLYSGAHNAGKAMILDGGTSWQQISVTPEDAELLASRRFSVEEIARIFQVPPPIIGDLTHGTFTNSETLIRFFATNTLSSWCRKIESEFSRSLLRNDDLSLELDLSGLLRGDPETRWKSHEIAVRNRILTPNEVRETEGWAPREGGDGFEQMGAQ